jgi:hypothetical protein
MTSSDELQISFALCFFSKNSSNDTISGNIDSEMLNKMRLFSIKIYYIS